MSGDDERVTRVEAAVADSASDDPSAETATPGRRATITTTHRDDPTAACVAASVRPDNTAAMDTRVHGDQVVTTIARETTGGLRATVDDYVVNATVAVECSTDSDEPPGAGEGSTPERHADNAHSDGAHPADSLANDPLADDRDSDRQRQRGNRERQRGNRQRRHNDNQQHE